MGRGARVVPVERGGGLTTDPEATGGVAGGDDADGGLLRSRWIRVAQILFVVAVAGAFTKVAVDNASELREVDLTLTPAWLVLAAPASLLAGPLLPLAWQAIVHATGHPLTARRAVRSWYLGQTGRYLPTGLVAFASRAALVVRDGVPQAVTLATVAIELGLIVVVGTTLAAITLPSSELVVELRVLLGAGGVVGLLAAPAVVRAVSGRVPRLDPQRAGGWSVSGLYRAEVLFLVNAAAKSAAFVLFASAVLPVDGGDVWLLAGAFNAANTLGTVGITPAGLGVREGAMAAILSARYGLGDAAALSVATRVWDTIFELAWLGIVQLRSFRTASDAAS